jgi:hypothetical protein
MLAIDQPPFGSLVTDENRIEPHSFIITQNRSQRMQRALFSIIAVLIAVCVLATGCTSQQTTAATAGNQDTSNSGQAGPAQEQAADYTFVKTITYTDENGSRSVLTLNKVTKTATIECGPLYIEPVENAFLNKTAFYEFGTTFTAGILQMAFFNETALEEFKQQLEAWNSQEAVVRDDSPPEEQQEVPEENPLEGYTVTKLSICLVENGTGARISDIVITGPGKDDVSIIYY